MERGVQYFKPFVYLIQGRKRNVVRYLSLAKSNSDLAVLSFDEPLPCDNSAGRIQIYLPKSTWAQGRNHLLEAIEASGRKYEYYIFLDDDVEFEDGSFEEFEQLLLKHRPAIGLPLFQVIRESYRYNQRLAVQHPLALDQQVQACSRQVIDDGIVMPLITRFDEQSWWYSCEINQYLILSCYRGRVAQFNQVSVNNTGHEWNRNSLSSADKVSMYKGGINAAGLDSIRGYLRSVLRHDPPMLQNSLFHDERYPRRRHIPRGTLLLAYAARMIARRDTAALSEVLRHVFGIQYTDRYPSDLIIDELEFRSMPQVGAEN